MTIDTPLDSLKTLAFQLQNQIDYVTETIAGICCDDDHQEQLECLDWVIRRIWEEVAKHAPGVVIETEPFWRVVMVPVNYSDGSPIREMIVLDDGSDVEYMPRTDGDRAEFVAKFNELHRPKLTIVTTEEG